MVRVQLSQDTRRAGHPGLNPFLKQGEAKGAPSSKHTQRTGHSAFPGSCRRSKRRDRIERDKHGGVEAPRDQAGRSVGLRGRIMEGGREEEARPEHEQRLPTAKQRMGVGHWPHKSQVLEGSLWLCVVDGAQQGG